MSMASRASICRIILWSVSLVVATELAYLAWRNWCGKTAPKSRKRRVSTHDIIMFRPYDPGENLTRSKYSRCLVSPPLKRIVHHLCSARHSLDVCIYVLTSADLANAILRLIRTRIPVRCIVDADMAFASGSQVLRLQSAGAMIRWRKSSNLMHHKFCIIDANTDSPGATPLLLTGSLNWTNQALSGNWENVLVTSQDTIVAQYKIEFERLWADFKANIEVPVESASVAERQNPSVLDHRG